MHSRDIKIIQPGKVNRQIAGFTLVEMLVVLSIILIISVFSYTAVNAVLEGDRVRGGARSISSFLEGARNRAIHAKQIRGVRFLLDDTIKESGNSVAVSSMVYIGAPENYSQGLIQVSSIDDRTITLVGQANWNTLVDRGLLIDGARIKVPNNTNGEWYTISYDSAAAVWKLNRPGYSGPTDSNLAYLLELGPRILANQEPRAFPRGVLIDLDESKIPTNWGSSRLDVTSPNPPVWGSVGPYSNTMDILFSPKGNIIGNAASSGLIHLLVADSRDVINNRKAGANSLIANTWDPLSPELPWLPLEEKDVKVGNEFFVTIVPLTGQISVYPVNSIDSDIDTGDPNLQYHDATSVVRLAEEGEVAK